MRKTAENAGAPCREISENAFKIQEITKKDLVFSTENRYDDTAEWKLRTTALYQPMNVVLALEAAACLIETPKASWYQILAGVVWKGRMEEVRPGVILDGAHNLAAVRVFTDSVCKQRELMPKDGRVIVLFSAVKEKDYREMIHLICREIPADLFVVTQISASRGVKAEEMKADFEQWANCPVVEVDTVEEAVRYVCGQKREQDRIYCFGSLYLVGEVEAVLREASEC